VNDLVIRHGLPDVNILLTIDFVF